MHGVHGGLTLVLRARRAEPLHQGHARVTAPTRRRARWNACDSVFKLGIFAPAKPTTWCRADDIAVRRRAAGTCPDRRQAAQPPGLLPHGDSARAQVHMGVEAHQHTPG